MRFLFPLLLLTLSASAQPGIRQRRVSVHGSSIYVSEIREAEKPLLLVHAGFQDRTMWDAQSFAFREKYRLITLDLPGHGETKDGPQRPEAAHVLLTVMDSLKLEKASILGLSLGSAVALEFASRHPERVEKLILAAPGIAGWEENRKLDTTTVSYFEKLAQTLAAGDTVAATAHFLQCWYAGPKRKTAQLPQEVSDYGQEITLRNMRRHRGHSAWPSFPAPTTIHRLNEVSMPVLILTGNLDMPEVLQVAGFLKKKLKKARLVSFRNAAHMLNLEQPDRFNKEVLQFLSTK